jgi:hypothetical protein
VGCILLEDVAAVLIVPDEHATHESELLLKDSGLQVLATVDQRNEDLPVSAHKYSISSTLYASPLIFIII